MTYSLDLKQRVIQAVAEGQSITAVSRTFQVGRATIYRWLKRPQLAPSPARTRRRKLDPEALLNHVRTYPEARLKDRAAYFQVNLSSIAYRLKQLKITRKKKQFRYRQRQPALRAAFLQQLRHLIQKLGSDAIVYADESGFEPDAPCLFAWSVRGKVVYGERESQRRPRENLIAARRRGEWLAPLLLTGSVTAVVFEKWLEEQLIPALKQPSVLILDNAAFHRPGPVKAIMAAAGHEVLFLPPYSPDFNKIEGDFGAIKRIRSYAPSEVSLDEIVANYEPRTAS